MGRWSFVRSLDMYGRPWCTGRPTGARRVAIAKFAVFFSYKPETWDQMLKKPGDRPAAVRDLASSVGGSIEAFYFIVWRSRWLRGR